jgi:hypothetical protein
MRTESFLLTESPASLGLVVLMVGWPLLAKLSSIKRAEPLILRRLRHPLSTNATILVGCKREMLSGRAIAIAGEVLLARRGQGGARGFRAGGAIAFLVSVAASKQACPE